MAFSVGSLVKTRGREWVILPESTDDLPGLIMELIESALEPVIQPALKGKEAEQALRRAKAAVG